jgi:hypothetical protein
VFIIPGQTVFQEATRPRAWGRNENLRAVLSWLWERIVGPVLARLDDDTTERSSASTGLSRLWWMPTGPRRLDVPRRR